MRNHGREDWVIPFAWAVYSVNIGVVEAFFAINERGKLQSLSPLSLKHYVYFEIVAFIPSIWGPLFAKASVALLLLRLLPTTFRWRRLLITVTWILLAFLTIACSVLGIYAGVSELPTGVVQGSQPAINARIIVLASWCALSSFTDFVYAIVGLVFIEQTQVRFRKRLAVGLLFSLGCLAGGLPIARAVMVMLDNFDIWETMMTPNEFWSYSETPAVIVYGSLLTLIPLWEKLINGRRLAPAAPAPPSVHTRQRNPVRRIVNPFSLPTVTRDQAETAADMVELRNENSSQVSPDLEAGEGEAASRSVSSDCEPVNPRHQI